MTNFVHELERRQDAYFSAMSEEDVRLVREADQAMKDAFTYEDAIQAGEQAPDFDLPMAGGGRLNLASAIRNGPVVVSFYRGRWCPFCSLEMDALARVHDTLEEIGASLVAISPQSEAATSAMRDAHKVGFPMLIDREARVSERYGLLYELPAPIRQMSQQTGLEPVRRDGSPQWLVPVPATYVIGEDRRVRYSFLDINYRNRLDPQLLSEIVARLRSQQLQS
ncbi:MAG: Fis family transcriptional regulator [Oceanibulbus sp.]|nr:Fis family transcriptional regulator [Sulfitobacter sp.]HBC16613.1 Fis family transcriptional regulator [Erythrobacter sp.]